MGGCTRVAPRPARGALAVGRCSPHMCAPREVEGGHESPDVHGNDESSVLEVQGAPRALLQEGPALGARQDVGKHHLVHRADAGPHLRRLLGCNARLTARAPQLVALHGWIVAFAFSPRPRGVGNVVPPGPGRDSSAECGDVSNSPAPTSPSTGASTRWRPPARSHSRASSPGSQTAPSQRHWTGKPRDVPSPQRQGEAQQRGNCGENMHAPHDVPPGSAGDDPRAQLHAAQVSRASEEGPRPARDGGGTCGSTFARRTSGQERFSKESTLLRFREQSRDARPLFLLTSRFAVQQTASVRYTLPWSRLGLPPGRSGLTAPTRKELGVRDSATGCLRAPHTAAPGRICWRHARRELQASRMGPGALAEAR